MAKTKAVKAAEPVDATIWRNRIVRYGSAAPADLVANVKNWRTHPKAQHLALGGALAKVGIVQNVVVNERSGRMIDGHLRVEMALDSKQPSVPITYVDLSDEEEALILATIDPVTGLAGTDQKLLDSLVTEIRLSDLGLDLGDGLNKLLQGLSANPAMAAQAGEDFIPAALATAPVSQHGDLWLMGGHRVLCGDATNAEGIARLLAAASGIPQPSLMVTDPPYGVVYDPNWRGVINHDGPSSRRATGKVTNDDRADWTAAYLLFPGNVMYVWHSGLHAGEVGSGIEAALFDIRAQIIWRKQQIVFGRGAYHWQHEPCYFAVRTGANANWCGDRKQSTVWDVPNANPFNGGSGQAEQTGHGTQKPVELMRRPILNHTVEGDAVYDCFLGSGSTMIAAELTKRVCYGTEIDPAYVDIIVTRWEKISGKKATLDGDGRTFEEIAAERAAIAAAAA